MSPVVAALKYDGYCLALDRAQVVDILRAVVAEPYLIIALHFVPLGRAGFVDAKSVEDVECAGHCFSQSKTATRSCSGRRLKKSFRWNYFAPLAFGATLGVLVGPAGCCGVFIESFCDCSMAA